MDNFLQYYYVKLKENFDNPELELRILLKKTSYNNKNIILSNFNFEDVNLNKFIEAFQRRLKREPISKIFNTKSFWKYNFFVNENVLDPRPETEVIIEQILKLYPNRNESLRILDMCTGSGCLAISLAKEYPNSKLVATDISTKAISIAKINSKKLNCYKQITFYKCDLISKIEEFDIVVANPPYLSKAEFDKTLPEVHLYDPRIALVALNNGYEIYDKIAKILPRICNSKSKIFLEVCSMKVKKIINLLKFNNIKCLAVKKDLQKLNRVLILKKS